MIFNADRIWGMLLGNMDHDANSNIRQKAKRRADWERNHAVIRKAFLECLKDNPSDFPGLKRLKERSGFSIARISNHLQELSLSTIVTGSPIKLLIQDVLVGLAKKGKGGDAFAAKLFFQIVANYVEKTKHDHSNEDGT